MVDIILSTYNGASYLEAQMDSIINQTYNAWRLIIRDDGSTDSTMAIINGYVQRFPDKICLLDDDFGNVGVVRSFEFLLRCATANYIMFCDQDDVWMPTKIDDTLHRMKDAERECARDIPLLVFTDLVVVDNSLQEVSPSFWKQNRFCVDVCCKFPYICVANCVAGCTMMINAPARSLVLPFSINVPVHDWWIAARVAKEGRLVYVNAPTILYRQHGKNKYGSRGIPKGYYFHRLLHFYRLIADLYAIMPYMKDIGIRNVWEYIYYKLSYCLIRRRCI